MPYRSLLLFADNLARAGFPHGFSTRGGPGGELGAFDFGPTAEPSQVTDNVRLFAEAARFVPGELRQVTQVHGARVVDADAMRDDPAAREEADALVLAPGGRSHARAVGVRVADCVPLLVGARDRRCVAAIHAGWRGVVAGVVGGALAKMESRELVAAVGPCIGPCCFEVGADVAAQIAEACGDPGVIVCGEREEGEDGAKVRVDLRRAVQAQLTRAGVRDIEQVQGCTKCEPERFFSFRRDGERSGRHLAVIALA